MLYILGGEDGDRELISMECYDIYSKTWTKQPDLTMVRKVSATGCGSWRLCKLTPKSVSLPGDGCCSGGRLLPRDSHSALLLHKVPSTHLHYSICF